MIILMQTIKKYFWQLLVVILTFILFLQNSCEPTKTKKDDNVIITKTKHGSISINKPEEIKNSIKYKYITLKGDTIILENPINLELANQYQKEKDSLQKEILFYKAIQKRKYKNKFEDKHILGTVYAETTGTLDSIGIEYDIKPDTIKIKQPVFRLLGGLSLQSNINTLKTNPGLNLGFQNKKNNIFLIGVNTNKDFEVKYIQNIFTIKK